jgi:hypothetical protein
MIMEIEKMKTYQVSGFSPEIELMKKINELVEEINRLKKKVKDMEERK